MYLWVILATFITLLYSYNLSVRPDMDRVHAETKARVIIDKFMAQHNAFKDYLTSLETSKTGQLTVPYAPGQNINGGNDKDILSSDCKIYSTGQDGYVQEDNKNCEAVIKGYLPLGYKLKSDPKDSNRIVSEIFCFDHDNNGYAEQCNISRDINGGSCCNNNNTEIFIITYQHLPKRWMNKETKTLNADFLGALSKVPGYGRIIGYTRHEGSDIILSGGQKTMDYSSGTEVIEERVLPPALGSGLFDNMCGGEYDYCLLEIQQIYK